MTQTPARRLFKELAGSTNHFLITILVGLDAVEDGTASLSPTFATSWAPHDRCRSARRSGEFARKALVSWLVDAVDAYITRLRRQPFLVQDPSSRSQIDAAGRSVFKKVEAISTVMRNQGADYSALVTSLIIWRNRLVHFEADNEIPGDVRAVLDEQSAAIASRFQGLDVAALLANLGESRAPTFKEAASLVRAAHLFVEAVDGVVLAELDLDTYFDEVLLDYVRRDPQRRIANIWGKDVERRRNSLRQLGLQYGLGEVPEPAGPTLTAGKLDALAGLSHRAALARLGAGSPHGSQA